MENKSSREILKPSKKRSKMKLTGEPPRNVLSINTRQEGSSYRQEDYRRQEREEMETEDDGEEASGDISTKFGPDNLAEDTKDDKEM